MAFDYGDVRYPRSKPAPVVFCIDVTGSMTIPVEKGRGKSRMELANDLVESFIKYILSVRKASEAVEVAFVLFAHGVVLETEFVRLKELSDETFRKARIQDCWRGEKVWDMKKIQVAIENTQYTNSGETPRFFSCYDKGTKIDSAILACYDKIQRHTEKMIERNSAGEQRALFYTPHFVLITDGDPDDDHTGRQRDDEKTHQKAMDMIYDHSYTGENGMNLIVPITVGVFGQEIGQGAIKRMDEYGENFKKGYFRVRDEKATLDFQKAAEFLCKTVVMSINLAWSGPEPEENVDPRGKRVEEIFRE